MKRSRFSECGCCGSSEKNLVHNVRHRGVFQRFCTSCVLKNHPGSFCPICFQVYNDPPPPHLRAMCLNCPSISHLSCVARTNSKLPPRYQCPPCSNPTFSFFNIGRPNDAFRGGMRAINEDKARQLVAASQIALESLNRAVALSRVDVDKKVKEAVAAKKGAKEALERLANLATQDKIESKSLAREKDLQVTTHSPNFADKSAMFRSQKIGEPLKSGAKEMKVLPSFTRR